MRRDPFKLFKPVLSKAKNISIITHWSPDGDAMGSSLGLYHYLKNKGKNVRVIVPNEYPGFLSWLPGNKTVLNFQTDEKKIKPVLEKSDVVFILDFNSYGRIEKLGALVAGTKAKKILIDHHQQPEDFADYFFHDVKACSTCELIYEFIEGVDSKKAIDKNIATCLYTGIMTDSGSFRFPSTTAKTHRIVAELIEAGADNDIIYNNVHDDYSYERLKLLGHCLNKMEVLADYHTAFISLSEAEQDMYHYQKGDTEGIVNYALSIKGIRFSAFLTERDGIVKISFRSKGSFDVNKFARKHFSGGGHMNAAGGKSDKSLDEAVLDFVNLLPLYKKELSKK
jgi:bifunctional oligoribonuclease and PAP phosphatase NrnA